MVLPGPVFPGKGTQRSLDPDPDLWAFRRVAQSSQAVVFGWGSELRNWTLPPIIPASYRSALLGRASLGGARELRLRQCPQSEGRPGPHHHTLALPAWRGASRQPAHAAAGFPLGAEVLSCRVAALGLRGPFGPGGGARRPRGAVPAGGRERARPLWDCGGGGGGGAALRTALARGFYLACPAAPATAALENF